MTKRPVWRLLFISVCDLVSFIFKVIWALPSKMYASHGSDTAAEDGLTTSQFFAFEEVSSAFFDPTKRGLYLTKASLLQNIAAYYKDAVQKVKEVLLSTDGGTGTYDYDLVTNLCRGIPPSF